jgi:hypothetical protein
MKRLFLLLPLLLTAAESKRCNEDKSYCEVSYKIEFQLQDQDLGGTLIHPADKGFNGHQKRDSWGNKVSGWPAQWIPVEDQATKKQAKKGAKMITPKLGPYMPVQINAKNALTGKCYMVAEALYKILGAKAAGWKPARLRHEGQSHWILLHEDGTILDPTAGQFSTTPDYSTAIGCGFLTKDLSRKTREALQLTLDTKTT